MVASTSLRVSNNDYHKKLPFISAFLWKYAMFAFLVTWPSDHGPIQEYYMCKEKTGFIIMILKKKINGTLRHKKYDNIVERKYVPLHKQNCFDSFIQLRNFVIFNAIFKTY